MRAILSILILSSCCAAGAASFDCRKAATVQEKAICASPELNRKDEAMGAAYRAVLAAAPAEFLTEFRNDQRLWILMRSRECKASENDGDALVQCLSDSTQSRTETLKHAILHEGGVTFVWRSVYFTGRKGAFTRQSGPDGERGSLSASWPQTAENAPEWKAWNAAVETETQQLASRGNSKPGDKWDPLWAEGLENDVNVSIGVVMPRLVTATVSDTWDGGGAHPNWNSVELNWMLKEKRELRPDDLFRSGSQWEATLYSLCDKGLRQQLGDAYQDWGSKGSVAEALHGIVRSPENWRIDGEGLSVVFQDYSVAPHAAQPEPVKIPWSGLQGVLNPDFQVPVKGAIAPRDKNS